MLRTILIAILAGISAVQASNLNRGMSFEEVQIELGRPESKMELGPKEVHIYADGTRLEFQGGELVKENDATLPEPAKVEPVAVEEPEKIEPLLENALQMQREDQTIGASIQSEDNEPTKIGEHYEYAKALEGLKEELENEQESFEQSLVPTAVERLQAVAIVFGAEVVITFIVLIIAFQIAGFPNVIGQLILLSLAVALAGGALDFAFGTDLLNPIRSALGFIILLVLIKQMTDVRNWVTAIKIAIIARVVSMALIWILMVGLMSIFSL